MKVSELTIEEVLNYIRELEDNLTAEDMKLIKAMQAAAISYASGQTGLTIEELDQYEEMSVAVLALISDMWDNRSTTVDRNNRNEIVENILYMHSNNLLPEVD